VPVSRAGVAADTSTPFPGAYRHLWDDL